MSLNTARERPVTAAGETNLFSVSFDGVLDSGETITGTPTATEETSSDLTISNVTASSTALTINNVSVAIGRAVQFKVVGQLVATRDYTIKITVVTDSSPAQTKIKYVKFVTRGA